VRLGCGHGRRFQKLETSQIPFRLLKALRLIDLSFAKEEELFDDRAPRVDVQAIGEPIEASMLFFGSGVDVEDFDRDLADSEGLRLKRRGEDRERDESSDEFIITADLLSCCHTTSSEVQLDGYKGGWIEIIAGGMFSGKSEELIRRLRRAVIARQRVQVFKPIVDDRFATDDIVSRDDRRLKASPVASSNELLTRVEIGVQVVGIDEVQFFDPGVVEVCMQLADAGIRVIAAGLDQDYMRRPFGPMPALLAVAEEVSKMHAVCVRCRGAAHYSQRVSGGDAQVEVGDSSYEARCRSCYELYKAAPEQEEPVVQLTIPQPA